MICKNCGYEMDDDQIFCPSCGYEIQYVPLYEAEEEIITLAEFIKAGDDSLVEASDTNGDKSEISKDVKSAGKNSDFHKNNKSKKTIIIAAILIVLLIIIGFSIYFISTYNSFDYQFSKAKNAYLDKDYKNAHKFAERAVELKEDDLNAKLILVKSYHGQRDMEEAFKVISNMLEQDSSEENIISIIEALVEANDYDHIGEVLDQVRDLSIIEKYEKYIVSVPKFNYPGGDFSREIKLEISSDHASEIYFSLDGSDPLKGTLYKGEILLHAGEYTVRAVAKNAYNVVSDERVASFNIEPKAPEIPIIKTNSKEINKDTRVILECEKGCTMYYTWDESTPSKNSTEYNEPFAIPFGNRVLSVIAIDNYGQMSSVAKKNFIQLEKENVEE